MIDVDEKQRQRLPRSHGAAPFSLQELVERAAIAKSSQAIGLSEPAQRGIRFRFFLKRTCEENPDADERAA
jgi:hypothetical protein